MNPQQFLDTYYGQALLWPGAGEPNRGQCVQSVCYYVSRNGKPVMWRDAADWWYSGLFPEHYERISNTATAVPQAGDLIIWNKSLPNSGGAGHIAVCLRPLPGTGTFISIDSNWGGKYVHQVTHNYNYVIGWLRLRVPAPQPPQEDPVRIAQLEQQVADLQTTINKQNETITKALMDDASDKQSLQNALAEVAKLNAQLATQHDTIVELQKLTVITPIIEEAPTPPAATASKKGNWFLGLLKFLFTKKKA